MKALSVRQPWAWLLLHGKDFENRSRQLVGAHAGYHGNTLLQSSKQPDPLLDLIIAEVKRYRGITVPIDELEFGGIVGVIRLGRFVVEQKYKWQTGPGYPVEATQVLPFYECKGKLGLWDFPDGDYLKLLHQLIDRGGENEHPDPETVVQEWVTPGHSN